MKSALLPVFFSLILVSCSKDYLNEAQTLEKQGRKLEAAAYYQKFSELNPSSPFAEDALFKAGSIYADDFQMCSRSGELFERLVKEYPQGKKRAEAYLKVFICPDYFPLGAVKKWYYGDCESKGKNARENIFLLNTSTFSSRADYYLYAGKRLLEKSRRVYSLENLTLFEKSGASKSPIIKYPLKDGTSWPGTKASDPFIYAVEKVGVTVKVRSGEFQNCLKIAEVRKGKNFRMVSYFAPGVGRVLTSIEGPGYENRIMELLKYER